MGHRRIEPGQGQKSVWDYPRPPRVEDVDNRVGGEKIEGQEGDFYGGWITSDVVGPFEGAPGTWGW
jgi:hypothetical protein